MTNPAPLPSRPPGTFFLPPERSGEAVLGDQARKVAEADYPSAILDGVNIPVFVLNVKRQIVFTNSAFREFVPDSNALDFIGRRAGEAMGCVHAIGKQAPGGCGTSTACRNCEAMLAIVHSRSQGQQQGAFRLSLDGGQAINAMLRATSIKVKDETFVICALVDIADTLWHRDVNRAFLHDVLNVAGSIRGASEALPLFDAETQKAYAERIVAACDTLIGEINSHRLMIQAEDGSLEPHFDSLDSLDFLRNMVGIVADHAAARNRTLTVAATAQSTTLETDGGLLSRVIINLLKNALEASLPGGTVTADTGGDANETWFTVHNQTAMSRKVADAVFHRFFSTKGSGRGIGTYAAKLLTEKYLGGRIGFTTDVNEGTTFRVSVPRRHERAAANGGAHAAA